MGGGGPPTPPRHGRRRRAPPLALPRAAGADLPTPFSPRWKPPRPPPTTPPAYWTPHCGPGAPAPGVCGTRVSDGCSGWIVRGGGGGGGGSRDLAEKRSPPGNDGVSAWPWRRQHGRRGRPVGRVRSDHRWTSSVKRGGVGCQADKVRPLATLCQATLTAVFGDLVTATEGRHEARGASQGERKERHERGCRGGGRGTVRQFLWPPRSCADRHN